MAQVDFSNAHLDVFEGNEYVNTYNPMNHDLYMRLRSSAAEYFYDLQGNSISRINPTVSIIYESPTKVSILYVGEFTASGTSFLIGLYSQSGNRKFAGWKVTNVSFNSGDSYSCVIDIETSGNTGA